MTTSTVSFSVEDASIMKKIKQHLSTCDCCRKAIAGGEGTTDKWLRIKGNWPPQRSQNRWHHRMTHRTPRQNGMRCMTLSSQPQKIRVSPSNSISFPYYEEMLRVFWATVKRPSTYEYNIIHGFNCACCGIHVPEDSNNKAKPNRKRERRYY